MTDEFRKTGLNTVTSSEGFSVEANITGGVLYRDTQGDEVRIDSEWRVRPHGILLYTRGLKRLSPVALDKLLANVTRGLEYLGHPVEIWPGDET